MRHETAGFVLSEECRISHLERFIQPLRLNLELFVANKLRYIEAIKVTLSPNRRQRILHLASSGHADNNCAERCLSSTLSELTTYNLRNVDHCNPVSRETDIYHSTELNMSLSFKDLDNKIVIKRTQSEANGVFNSGTQFENSQNLVIAAKILSYKLKKDQKDSSYVAYCVHVSLLSGAKWVVEKRYSQFRDFRKELLRYTEGRSC